MSFLCSSLSSHTSLHSKGSFHRLEHEVLATVEWLCGQIHPIDPKSREAPFPSSADQMDTWDSIHNFSKDHGMSRLTWFLKSSQDCFNYQSACINGTISWILIWKFKDGFRLPHDYISFPSLILQFSLAWVYYYLFNI